MGMSDEVGDCGLWFDQQCHPSDIIEYSCCFTLIPSGCEKLFGPTSRIEQNQLCFPNFYFSFSVPTVEASGFGHHA